MWNVEQSGRDLHVKTEASQFLMWCACRADVISCYVRFGNLSCHAWMPRREDFLEGLDWQKKTKPTNSIYFPKSNCSRRALFRIS